VREEIFFYKDSAEIKNLKTTKSEKLPT